MGYDGCCCREVLRVAHLLSLGLSHSGVSRLYVMLLDIQSGCTGEVMQTVAAISCVMMLIVTACDKQCNIGS